MSTLSVNSTSGENPATLFNEMMLPIVRSPMLGSDGQLFAYELLCHRELSDAEEESVLMGKLLSTIADGSMTRLLRGNRAFVRLSHAMMLEQTDVLAQHPRFGVIIEPGSIGDAALMERLQQLAQRNCPLLLDLSELDPDLNEPYGNLEPLLSVARYVRLDAGAMSAQTLTLRSKQLHERGLNVIAGGVDDHVIHSRCQHLPMLAVQGRYLLLPEQIDVPVLTPNRLSLLRLMRALQENNPGPVELGAIIRDDVVLSYKLLGCVNSAYFALPRQLKSIQQAAIFFGVARMRNWIYTMALSAMDDRPPELLRAALIRAHMCEKLARSMSAEKQDMAFMAGLLSLLDTLMCAPMEFLLSHLPLADEIKEALLQDRGPFAPLLGQIYAWEGSDPTEVEIPPQNMRRMADAYLEATQWADQVYAFADQRGH